jgi:O-antigen/teichoic acid export membrane protein
MRREFFTNVFFLILINLLIKPLYIFGIERTVQNRVGEEAYGVYFSLLSFSILFYIIHEPGIYTFNASLIAQNPRIFSRYFPALLWLKIILSGLFVLTTFFFAWLIGYEIAFYKLLFLICINQVLHTFIFFLRSNVSGLGFYRWDSVLSSLDRFLLLFLMGAFLFTDVLRYFLGVAFSIEIFLYVQMLTLISTVLACLWVIYWKTKVPILNLFGLRWKRIFLWAIFKKVMPYALSVFLMAIYGRMDAVLLARWLPDGKYQVGIYAAAYRLLDAANMVGVLMASLLIPMYAKLWGEKKHTDLINLLKIALQLVIVGSVTLAAAFWVVRSEVMALLYTHTTAFSGDILGVLMWSFVVMSSSYVVGSLLTAIGYLAKANAIFLMAIALNFILNFIFIHNEKALGAAKATLLTEILVFAGQFWLVAQLLKTEFYHLTEGGRLWRILAFILVMLFISLFFPLVCGVWTRFVIVLGCGAVAALLLKIIALKPLLHLLKKGEK